MSEKKADSVRISRAAAGMIGASLLTGCAYSFEVPVHRASELGKPTGALEEPREVTTVRGDRERLSSSFQVIVLPRTDRFPWARPAVFEDPTVTKIDRGMLVIRASPDQRPALFPVEAIQSIRVRQISSTRVLGIAAAIMTGTAATFLFARHTVGGI